MQPPLIIVNPAVIHFLLDAGADATIKDGEGKLAIDYAVENENLKGTNVLQRLQDATRH